MKRINTDAGKQIIQDALKKYNSYGDEWEKVYFDEFSGGFNVYHEKHQFTPIGGGGDAEKKVGKMLAKYNGKQVEFLAEGDKKSADLFFDNKKWDIKFPNGEYALTCCLGFGIERWCYAIICQFGYEEEKWPDNLRQIINDNYK